MKPTDTIDPLALIRQHGQLDSADLAERCGMTEKVLAARLYPSIAAGAIVQCSVIRKGKPAGHQYRWSGWVPPRSAGAPVKAAAKAAEGDEDAEE